MLAPGIERITNPEHRVAAQRAREKIEDQFEQLAAVDRSAAFDAVAEMFSTTANMIEAQVSPDLTRAAVSVALRGGFNV